ncbi:hypothetical protein WJX72_011946 [[Myrmecia] bisecta]|uniref:Uncharacterized protein n=1 Tax=[Myrmecia] bisecta TaxID=41462 RepID=A0AAW1RA92_9CHLO
MRWIRWTRCSQLQAADHSECGTTPSLLDLPVDLLGCILQALDGNSELKRGDYLTDAGITQLSVLRLLRELNIQAEQMTDEGWQPLTVLTSLQHLVLEFARK